MLLFFKKGETFFFKYQKAVTMSMSKEKNKIPTKCDFTTEEIVIIIMIQNRGFCTRIMPISDQSHPFGVIHSDVLF